MKVQATPFYFRPMRRSIHYVWLAALLLTPFVLWALPANFFNDGNGLSCPSQSLLGLECLGCGMTRAVMHLHHFDFTEAIFYNTGVVVIYPFLIWLWQRWVRAEVRWLRR
jgi:hypothetical protein